MNYSNSQIDVNSLISKMEQLEQNYKALYKYFVRFKSQLEDLKQQLHQPSEIDPLQVLQSQVYALQRQLQDSETVSEVLDTATTEMIVDNAEIATPILMLLKLEPI